MSRVSIVIPCHNDGVYLPETVACALAQTHQDVEIVIVDDYSQDAKTLDILQSMQQYSCVKVIRNNGAKGVAAARNLGNKHANGEYILPLDADDKIAPSYAAKAAAVLDSRPEIGICYCQAEFFGLKKGQWQLKPFSLADMLLSNLIFVSAMYRRADWEAVGGYAENVDHIPEDYFFWLALLNLGVQVWQIPETLFYYRIRAHSRSSLLFSNAHKQKQIDLDIFSAQKGLYQKNIKLLYLKALELSRANQVYGNSLSYRLMKPLNTLEIKLKTWLKKKTGRSG